jgi:protein-disulfide isomerase
MENAMRSMILAGTVILSALVLAPSAPQAQDLRGEIEAVIKDYLASHPDEVGEIVKDYFTRHPEAVGAILAEMLKQHRAQAAATGAPGAPPATAAIDRGAAVARNAGPLFSSPHQVTLGNPDGDVTLVEFFDYSCGFCKRAMSDMLALIKDDPKLKIVLKEFPILGPGSVDAARVAAAVRMQDAGGQKYLAFHQELLGSAGPASREKALAAARDQGVDMARLEGDLTNPEVAATLSESTTLATALGITGTPGYVIGDNVVLGAVGLAALQTRIQAARTHSTN